jgi:hypothetical protein
VPLFCFGRYKAARLVLRFMFMFTFIYISRTNHLLLPSHPHHRSKTFSTTYPHSPQPLLSSKSRVYALTAGSNGNKVLLRGRGKALWALIYWVFDLPVHSHFVPLRGSNGISDTCYCIYEPSSTRCDLGLRNGGDVDRF